MPCLQLELSKPVRQFVETEAARAGFSGPGEYIESVLRDLQMYSSHGDLDAALLEGLDSPSADLRPEEWDEMRQEALQRIAAGAST